MKAIRRLLLLSAGFVLLLVQTSPVTASSTERFTFNWLSTATSPQPWTPDDWDVIVHSRDRESWAQVDPMQAQHGPDCSPPPATHLVSSYEESVYLCRNHMMTAINGSGYGAIYFAPNRLVDFGAGTASIRYRVSTTRMSDRDWHDIWITPFEDNLVLPRYFGVDLQGPPRNAIHIDLAGNNAFQGAIFHNFAITPVPRQRADQYEWFLQPSATTRSEFELDISRTHIRFGMPQFQVWWIDTDVPDLGFSQGVVQLGHHSYNPTKATNGQPGTWHWSDFSISSAVPFTMLRGSQQSIHQGASPEICFRGAAPSDSWLRFAGVGEIEVSYDGGRNFIPAKLAAQNGPHSEGAVSIGLFASYWTPVPAGVSSVVFRGKEWWGGPWWVRDPAIWSRSTAAPAPANGQCPRVVSPPGLPAAALKPPPRVENTPLLVAVDQKMRSLAHRFGTRNLEAMAIGLAVIVVMLAAILGFALGRRRGGRGRRRLRARGNAAESWDIRRP
jgi:hypothetical protein